MLASHLTEIRGMDVVVLGIPRGGVVVARELARGLDAQLDIVLSRKLRTPGYSELALGSVSEDGRVFLNDSVVQELGVSRALIEQERQLQLAEIARRAALMRNVYPRVPLQGRIVVVTDDGIATGATFEAAVWSARHDNPRKVIGAVPVGSRDNVVRLSAEVDEMLCLRAPPSFFAVGQFYTHFEPVQDEDIVEMLREELAQKQAKEVPAPGSPDAAGEGTEGIKQQPIGNSVEWVKRPRS